MGYSDALKRRTETRARTAKSRQSVAKETIRFSVGTIYKSDGIRYVCVDRYTDSKGTHVGMVELSEIREEKKDEWGDLNYKEAREGGFACHEEYFVRTHKGIEYAIDESDLCLLDGESEPSGGRYDIDCDGCLEEVPDVAFLRADKSYGTESLEMPEPKVVKREKKRKTKKGNPIAGIFLIVVILSLIRACSS